MTDTDRKKRASRMRKPAANQTDAVKPSADIEMDVSMPDGGEVLDSVTTATVVDTDPREGIVLEAAAAPAGARVAVKRLRPAVGIPPMWPGAEPPTEAELDAAAFTVRRRTTTLRPGGIAIRWRNLTEEQQARFVQLVNRRTSIYNRELWDLVQIGDHRFRTVWVAV